MSAIDPSINNFKQICELAERNIAEHFNRFDLLEDKSKAEILKVPAMSLDIARALHMEQTEVTMSVNLYLRNRSDLMVRSGKYSGIYRVADNTPKAAMTPQECAMRHYDAVVETSVPLITAEFAKARQELTADNIKQPARLNFQELCDVISQKLKLKHYVVYHCLRTYINKEQTDWHIRYGRYGGLFERQS